MCWWGVLSRYITLTLPPHTFASTAHCLLVGVLVDVRRTRYSTKLIHLTRHLALLFCFTSSELLRFQQRTSLPWTKLTRARGPVSARFRFPRFRGLSNGVAGGTIGGDKE